MSKNELLGKLFGLALEFQNMSGHCVFLDYSGHVGKVTIRCLMDNWESGKESVFLEEFNNKEIKIEKIEKLIADFEEMINRKDYLPNAIEKSCFYCKWHNNKGICYECDIRRHSEWIYCRTPVEYKGMKGWCATCKNKSGVGKSKTCLQCASNCAMTNEITNYETDENFKESI